MKTNLLYALRNIRKNSTNSIISVVGLSLAIACCLWIFFFIRQEKSFNMFHANIDRIYRLNYELKHVGFNYNDVRLEPEIAELLPEKVPQIETCTAFRTAGTQLSLKDGEYYDIAMSYGDPEFFHIFSFPLIAGSLEGLFQAPDEIVISRGFADKLLDSQNYESLLGEPVQFPNEYPDLSFRIAAIVEDFPENSGIRFEGMIPGENGRNFGGCDNDFGYSSIFYLLQEDAHAHDAEHNITAFLEEYYADRVQESIENQILVDSPDAFRPFAIPFSKSYLRGDINTCFETLSSGRSNFILIIIGTLILLIACINYTLLSIGQSFRKIGDVGVRKVMGARKSNLFMLFFFESIVLTGAAFLLGSFLFNILLSKISQISQTEIYFSLVPWTSSTLLLIIAFLVITSAISIIPVIIFSGINPQLLGSKKLQIGKRSILSQVFISLQYSISIVLIIGTIFIVRQANYMKEKSLGVTTDNTLDIDMYRLEDHQKRKLRDKLAEHPGVLKQTFTSRNFLNGTSNSFVDKGNGERILIWRIKVDENYLSTLDIELVFGEDFTADNVSPEDRSILVNESFIKDFGIEDSPIGKTYNIAGTDFTIIGVVKDFNFLDLRESLKPAMLFTREHWNNSYYSLLLRFQPDQLQSVIKHLEKSYQEVAGGKLLTYTFWDEQLALRYVEEERWSKLIGYAAVIAILISSLGLFGLTILLINQRIKEIGIRKVNGARSLEILVRLNRSFLGWLLLSIGIATPVSIYLVHLWLQNYSYRINISWWIFGLSGLFAFIVAITTVSWHSWRAASRNPVEALRYE